MFPVLPISFSAASTSSPYTSVFSAAADLSLYLSAAFVTASAASCSWVALSEIMDTSTAPLQAASRAGIPQPGRLSRRASKPAWDISAPDCLSGWETSCHSAASTPSPHQMFCGSALIWAELWCKLYFCVYFSSASSSCSVIFIHQFLF